MALEADVHWRQGPAGVPEPVTFRIAGIERSVAAVLDRWPGSEIGYVKIRGEDDDLYILRYEDAGNRWSIIFYQSDEPLPEGIAGVKPHLV
ncbi:hypothetical protein [Thiohalomonas denitrificans]|uniref:hypothetical protein n=1 Tax=Thiohalomonas denitrificans TaxID=415747 RepID=UPI0026F10820|nr:hypothetical protein [Thiohalomonas denitrificans]